MSFFNKNKRPVRSSQLITTWGVGSIQSFPNDDSFMLLGLDLWDLMYNNMNSDRRKQHLIDEPRLARRLNVTSFRKPIMFDEQEFFLNNRLGKKIHMPYHRFPNWHWCPQCGQLKRVGITTERRQKTPNQATICDKIFKPCKNTKQTVELVPSRFILICADGHIDDFPYEWVVKKEVEKQKKDFKEPNLRLIRGNYASSTILSMSVECINNKVKVPLKGMYHTINNNKGLKCNGKKPWLGIYGKNHEQHKECELNYTLTYRNALNVHSKITKSAISLPLSNQILPDDLIERINNDIRAIKISPETSDTFIQLYEEDYPDIQRNVIKSYMENLLDENYSESEFRNEEYDILTSGGGSAKDKLFFAEPNNSYFKNKHLMKIFKSISVVHKLVETRAFVGFNRLTSGELTILSNDENIDSLKSNLSIKKLNWLPAYQASGEGIFLNFNQDFIDEWSEKEGPKKRLLQLQNNFNRDIIQRGGLGVEEMNPSYPAIHSFSHLLIDKLSYHAGYGASSLREKLYVNFEKDSDTQMSGLLIYTIGGGDGSLGGLCSLVDNNQLEEIIIDALLESIWCSSDPICLDSNGQGNGLCNLAACHNCILVPETSCESFNILLDRKILTGSESHSGLFNELMLDILKKM